MGCNHIIPAAPFAFNDRRYLLSPDPGSQTPPRRRRSLGRPELQGFLCRSKPTHKMKADLSATDIIRIQVVSRLSDLLFDELQKIKLDGAPLECPAHPPCTPRKRRRYPARESGALTSLILSPVVAALLIRIGGAGGLTVLDYAAKIVSRLTRLAQKLESDYPLLAVIKIKAETIPAMKAELGESGVTQSVVFPDLDGLGREVNQLWLDRCSIIR
jgi:hypothetical protein